MDFTNMKSLIIPEGVVKKIRCGDVVIWGGALLTFYIQDTSYQAEYDMTWEQWVNSEYNTNGCFISDNYVCLADGNWVGSTTSTCVLPAYKITSDANYYSIASFKNWVKYSTESDDKTIYNGGKGYKDGYRLRSGGAEAAADDATHTGFIPAVAGDEIVIGGVVTFGGTTTSNAINVYDASHTNLGQVVENFSNAGYGIFSDGKLSNWNKGTLKNGCFYWTVPSGADIAYVRITARTKHNGASLIVTKNEEPF